ncbi:MAG: transposase [Candidatus Electronema sp. VV]
MLSGRCSGIFFLPRSKAVVAGPAAPSRNILNSLLYILIVGCRWCDLPRGPQWASKSSSHRRLKSWHHGRSIRSKRDCSVLLRMRG